MAYEVTARALDVAAQVSKTPNLVFVVYGYNTKFSSAPPEVAITYDSGFSYDDPELFYDGLAPMAGTKDYISFTGTTDTVSQQLEPDKGGASSTSSMNIKLVDFNDEITELITPNFVADGFDALYRECMVLFGFLGTDFNVDYIELFNGNITAIKSEPGSVTFTVSHPDDIKRSDIFVQANTKLTQPLNFRSETIQDIFYQTRNDVVGIVDISYVNNPGLGNDATIAVFGNSIVATIEAGFTTAKTLKKKIESDEDASQLVLLRIAGNASATQVIQSSTQLLSDDEVFVEDASLFLQEYSPRFTTYVRVADEIIRYTGIDLALNKLTGCTREQLTSFGARAEIGDEAHSYYRLGDTTFDNGNAIDLALNVMLSGGDHPFADNINITSINFISDVDMFPNAVFFSSLDIQKEYGVVVGDFASITGSTGGLNDFSDKLIAGIVKTASGSYLIMDGVALVDEADCPGVISFESQFAVLPDGAGISPRQVDIDQFINIKNTFSSGLATYAIDLKETTKAKDLVNQRIFLPSSLYSLPRKGRVSVGYTAPPLFSESTKVLTLDDIKKPSGLDLNRSVQNLFYNAITYKYNQDSVTDKFLNGNITISTDSTARIKAPTKSFTIEADGIRAGVGTDEIIDINSRRLLQRYQFGAESIPDLEVPVDIGWTLEVGDAIVIGDSGLQISDTKTGNRRTGSVIYEISNKSYNWRTGLIKISLTNTSYSLDLRYGTWSPSSVVGTGSDSFNIHFVDSIGLQLGKNEKDKWQNYIGHEVNIHSEDFSVSETTYIEGFDPNDNRIMIVNPALSFSPAAGYLIDIVNYEDLDTDETLYRAAHLFWDPSLVIVSGISSTQFTVSAPDAAKLYVGSAIRVHNSDYTIDSGLVAKKVTDISGTTITCTDIGFTPSAGQNIDFVGFYYDEGAPYAWL